MLIDPSFAISPSDIITRECTAFNRECVRFADLITGQLENPDFAGNLSVDQITEANAILANLNTFLQAIAPTINKPLPSPPSKIQP